MHRYRNCLILIVGLLVALTSGIADASGTGMEKKMQRGLSESRSLVVKMKAGLESRRPIGSDLNRLKALAQEISDIHAVIEKEFVETEKKVNGLGAHAADRYQRMKNKYRETVEGFLNTVLPLKEERDVNRAVLDALLNLLNDKSLEKKRPIFGTLPYRHLNLPARLPVKTPVMIPAYKGGDKTAREADLLSVPEAAVTREIALLAESLHWNPVEIYTWVKNNIETQWYWGCMKGAAETLRQKSGNDADQACLLIALLRAAGYPCRFVQGVIRFFPNLERAKHLIGVADEVGVASFFQKAGIANSPVIAGGRIANFEIEHIWVETFVPWSNYRGGAVDDRGKLWVALDTAIKVPGFSLTPGADILDEIPLTGMRESYLEVARPETPLAFFKAKIQQYLDARHPQSTYASLVPVRTQLPEKLMLLPASLQFEQAAITGEYTKLPDTLFHKARFQAISSSQRTLFDKTIEVFRLSNRKIVLTYEPESVEDQETVNSFGGLGNTPCYLIRLRPVLVVDDERFAIGEDGLSMGEDYTLGVDLSWPGGSAAITNTHIAGNQSVMGIVAQQAVIGDEPETAAGLLHRAAMGYIKNWNRSEEELARFYRLALVRPIPTVVTLGGVVEVSYLLDIPHGFDWKGVYVDADLRAVETAGGYGFTDTTKNAYRLFMEMAGLEGSVLEGKILEDAFEVESISTAKLLGIARQNTVTIRTLNKTNIATDLPAWVSGGIAEDITNAVNQGMIVRIPGQEMSHEDWSGIGYVKEIPETGEAGWMLSGMIAGGMTAWGLDRWPQAYLDILSNAYTEEPPNQDPQSGQSIQKITATDQQRGTVGQALTKPFQVLVRDREQRPVSGAPVTFKAIAGGGRFSNQQGVITTRTDGNGIATANFILGEVTGANPTFWWEDGYTNTQQVGENIVTAALSSGVAVRIPFTAFGFPGNPARIIAEANSEGTFLSFAGYIRSEVQDTFGNSISNQMVTFAVQPPVVTSTCPNPNTDTRTMVLFQKEDPCLRRGFPIHGDCASQASVVDAITNHRGTLVYTIAGAIPEAQYQVLVSCGGLSTSVAFHSHPYGNCSGNEPPSHDFSLATSYLSDDTGQNIDAAPPGAVIPLQAWMHYTSEAEKEEAYSFNCNGVTKTCTRIVGARRYSVNTAFTSASVNFGGVAGMDEGSGVYSAQYVVRAGVNEIVVTGSATIKRRVSIPDCANCRIEERDLVRSAPGTITVYGVEIQTDPEVLLPVDPEGLTVCDTAIAYEILPSAYTAGSAFVVIYKNAEPIAYLPSETRGAGSGIVGRGFRFDPNTNYEAQILLNAGTAVEIKSNKIPLRPGAVKVESIHMIDPQKTGCKVPLGGEAKLAAITLPEGRAVRWSIPEGGRDEGVKAKIDILTGVITAESESASGWVKVRATDAQVTCIYKEAMVYVGCPDCAKGVCVILPGSGAVNLASVDIQLSLGRGEGGVSAGNLFLRSKEMSPALATPKSLEFSTLIPGVEERRDASGVLRQIRAPESFADIVTLDEFGFEVRFYRPEEITGENNGLYQIAGTPHVIWRIKNPDASPVIFNRLSVSEIKGADTQSYSYLWDEGPRTWSLVKGGGLQTLSRAESTVAGNREVTETIKDDRGAIASKTRTTYHGFPWGEEIISVVTDPDGAALTTQTAYYEDAGKIGSYGNIKSVQQPDGAWRRYEYDREGRKLIAISALQDAPIDAPAGTVRALYYEYTPVDGNDTNASTDRQKPRTVTEKMQGIVTAKTYFAYLTTANDTIEITEQCARPDAAYGDPGNLRTQRVYFPSSRASADSGRIKSVSYPDGRLDLYTYESGTYVPNPGSPGTFTPGAGTARRETVLHTALGYPSGIALKSTLETTVQNALGETLFQATDVYTGSGYERLQWSVQVYDGFGRVQSTHHSNGTRNDTNWTCCAKESETDETGIVTHYAYDGLKRLVRRVREGAAADAWPGQADIETSFIHDAAGRTVKQTTTSGGLTLQTQTAYDLSGRTQSVTNEAGLITRYDYAAGGATTVTRPGGITEVTKRYLDGTTRETSGTGVVPTYYTHGVNADGSRWTKVSTGSADGPAWEKTTVDMLGRTILAEKPGATGIETTQNIYDTKGRLVKTTTTDRADTLYVYDALGNQIRAGLDVDGNGALEPASGDRITDSDTTYITDSGAWWQETSRKVYATTNSALPTTTSLQRVQLTGLGAGGITSRSLSIDINGNETVSEVKTDRATKLETRTIDYPDSDIDAEAVSKNGLAVSNKTKTGVLTTLGYDALGRQVTVTDARTGASETHYNDKHQIDWVSDAAGNRTSFAYDPVTGQKISETNALGKVTRFAYNTQGQITRTWGDAAYPVKYVFDAFGKMTEMRTYRSDAGFTGVNFPEGATGDVTTWHYHDATGLLTSKEFADRTRVSYAYTTGAKLLTRTWARTDGGNPLVTTYSYDPDTGELLDIDYSDGTPDVSFVYDRLGRQTTVTDAVGSRAFAYNTALQLKSETITGLYNQTITRTYETTGVPGRNTGFTLGVGYAVTYGYDTSGRLKTLGWNAGSMGSATYNYVPDSDLIETLSTGSGQLTSYAYEPKRNLKTSVQNGFNAGVISKYDYRYDAIGRRESVANTGTAFVNSAFNKFGYNDRSELTTANRYLGTVLTDISQPVDPEKRLYAYDPIGNRGSATEGAALSTYAANNLNQYNSVTSGGTPKALSYDADGNLTGKDSLVYKYDAENRLIAITPASAGNGATKLDFIYDYIGRRVKKTVSTCNAGLWTAQKEILFVYDGWNMVQEETVAVGKKHYVWGLDLSQSLQGAGGVGGLLAVVNGADTYHYCYDGNGNVGQMVNAAGGGIEARYEYDPFGNTIVGSGSEADSNPYRFSTKYLDKESGLYYYGYRYYLAELGRWLSRDPAEDGFNPYAFVNNAGINVSDLLGLLMANWKHDGYAYIETAKDGSVSDYISMERVTAGELAEKFGLSVHDLSSFSQNSSILKLGTSEEIIPACSKVWVVLQPSGEKELLSRLAYAEGTALNKDDKYAIASIVINRKNFVGYNYGSTINDVINKKQSNGNYEFDALNHEKWKESVSPTGLTLINSIADWNFSVKGAVKAIDEGVMPALQGATVFHSNKSYGENQNVIPGMVAKKYWNVTYITIIGDTYYFKITSK